MPYPAAAIANEFLHLAKEENRHLTPMKLLKLVYFAHGWYLALAGRPLINEPVEAWKFGPVISSLYHALKKFGNTPIREFVTEDACFGFADPNPHVFSIDDAQDKAENTVAKNLAKRIWELYGGFSPFQLSNLTHEPGSPWHGTTTKDKKRNAPISEDSIRKYFLGQAENKHKQYA
jgi:uncharacterized phage-associated protein